MIKYRAFIQVVESGSITKAAKVLGYSQPGISYMIDSLEKEMGFPLLIYSDEKLIEDGVSGLLFPVGDREALSACLRRLLEDDETRRALARAAREKAEDFRPEAVFGRWDNYVQSVIDGKGRL